MTIAAPTPREVQLVVFLLGEHRYALALDRVERVLRMVAVAPFPKAPAIVSGVLDLHGTLVPVIDIRRRCNLPERAPTLSDQLIVVRTAGHRMALAVEGVEAVVHVTTADVTPPESVIPGLEQVQGIVQLASLGIVFVYDLDRFLSLDEATTLTAALEGTPA